MTERPIPPEAIDLDFAPRPRGALHAVDVAGTTVLYDEVGGRAHELNQTAGVVWRCLDGATPLGGLVDELAAAYEVPGPEIAPQVLELVQALGREGLLENVEGELQFELVAASPWEWVDGEAENVAEDAAEDCEGPTEVLVDAGVDPSDRGGAGGGAPVPEPRYLAVPPST